MTVRTLLRACLYPEDISYFKSIKKDWVKTKRSVSYIEKTNRAFIHDILLQKYYPVCELPEEQKIYDFHRSKELVYLYFESTEELHAHFLQLSKKYDSLFETHNITVFLRAVILGIINLSLPPDKQTPYLKPVVIIPKRPIGRPPLSEEERARRAAIPKRPVGRPRLTEEEKELRRLQREKEKEKIKEKQKGLRQKTQKLSSSTKKKKSKNGSKQTAAKKRVKS